MSESKLAVLGGSGFQFILSILGEQCAAIQAAIATSPPLILRTNPDKLINVEVVVPPSPSSRSPPPHPPLPIDNRVDPGTLARLDRPDLDLF